jgi:hypothetical protein
MEENHIIDENPWARLHPWRWVHAQLAKFYNSGISKLVVRWDKCLNRGGDYVEK